MGGQLLSRMVLGINYFLQLISGVLYVRFICSWILDPFNRFYQILVSLTEPFVAPVRNVIKRLMGDSMMRIDFSIMVTGFLITLIRRLIFSLLI